MRSKNPDRWTENEWLQQLSCHARQLCCCEDDAADLAHAALYAFLDHFQHYPWQHDDALSAWRWCCQKLRSLSLDERRQAQHHPTISLEELSEGVACVEVAPQVEGEADVEAFLAWLPKRLREGLRLRLAGYSWEEAAQRLRKKASTLRGYLPELRAKFVEFFGFDPSNRASESLIYMEGESSPSNEAENGGQSDASDRNEEQGFSDDTGSTWGG